jgi:hypothetical protein
MTNQNFGCRLTDRICNRYFFSNLLNFTKQKSYKGGTHFLKRVKSHCWKLYYIYEFGTIY